MSKAAVVALLVCTLIATVFAQPQRQLVIRVTGDIPDDLTLRLRLTSGDRAWDLECVPQGGVCRLDVESVPLTVSRIVTPPGFAVVEVRGVTAATFSGELWFWFRPQTGFIGLVPTREGIAANLNVLPREEGGALTIDVEVRRAQVVAINLNQTIGGLTLYAPVRWRYNLREENGTLLIVVPRGFDVQMAADIDERSSLGRVLARVVSYGVAQRPGFARGLVTTFPVRYGDPNASLAYFAVRGLRENLESYLANERGLLSKVGFDAEAYLSDVEFAVIALKGSEDAFKAGEFLVGQALLERGLAKAASALDSLSQAKADSVPSFLFLLTFTLFLSLIVGNLFERRKGVVAAAVFGLLSLAEVALVPYARLALLYLDPSVLQRASPSSMITSLLTATLGLAIIGAFVLGAKGTALSDFFWYSVRSMRRRKLRAILTIATVAVVTAVATAFLALGSTTVTREETYQSSFRGLSVSRHVTTTMYIFRGLDQANEYIVTESYVPLTTGEVKWLTEAGWVKRVYTVEAGLSIVLHGESRALATVVATDAISLSGAAVSRSLADRLNVTVGSTIRVAGRPTPVASIFSDDQPPVLLDGTPLLELPQAQSQGIIIVPLELAPPGLQVYKLLLEGDPPAGLRDQLVRMSYVWSGNMTTSGGAQITTYVYESFRVCEADGSATSCLVIVGEFVQATAVPEFMIVLLLSAAVVAISLLGSMYERGKEYSTVSALGASPAYVSALVLIEGLSYGILGGVAGFILGQFFQSLVPVRVVAVKPSPFSPALMSVLVALLPSVIGSVLPAREAALKVVPSRLMLRKSAEVKVYQDMAEAYVPLRITGDAEEFARYVQSLVHRAPPVGWGPIYMRVDVRRRDGRIDEIEALVSFRSERAAMYLAKILLPREPGETVRVVAHSATGEWTIDHKACAKDFLTSIRDDLLHYIDWKKRVLQAK
ncbi:MAG: ABC transporter permease [Thermofilaceae archaeon]